MANNQMHTGDTTITTELPIVFHTLSGESISALLSTIHFQSDEQMLACHMVIEVNSRTYQDIIDNEWFNLFTSMRKGTAVTMDENQPIEIHLSLRPSLTKLAARHGFDAENIFDSLRSSTEPDPRLLKLDHSECWLALELKQSVVLPEALKESGELTIGMRSAWLTFMDQENMMPDGASAAEVTLSQHIRAFLAGKAMKYEMIDEHLIKLRFSSNGVVWVGLIRIEEARNYAALYSVYPELVPAHQHQELALLLLNENMDLLSGSFEFDDEDGELRFRSPYISGTSFEAEVFGKILTDHLQTVEQYFPEIREVLQR